MSVSLSATEKKRLAVVIEVAGTDEGRIRDGIIQAIKDVNAPETRNYLWRILTKAAQEKIRRMQKRKSALPFSLN